MQRYSTETSRRSDTRSIYSCDTRTHTRARRVYTEEIKSKTNDIVYPLYRALYIHTRARTLASQLGDDDLFIYFSDRSVFASSLSDKGEEEEEEEGGSSFR